MMTIYKTETQAYDDSTTKLVSQETTKFEFEQTGRIKAEKGKTYTLSFMNTCDKKERFIDLQVLGATTLFATSATLLSLAALI